MKKIGLITCALLVTAVPARASTSLEEALKRVPTLEQLCGTVPVAPEKVRGNSEQHPIRRNAKKFIKAIDQWQACATEMHAKIQPMVLNIQDDIQRSALAAHLNDDFQQRYDVFNKQIAIFTDRVNHRLVWRVRPARPSIARFGGGTSSNRDNQRLQTAKRLTLKADINRPIYHPNQGFLEQTVIAAPQFTD